MDFTPAQYDAITLPNNLVVTAGAGSGKTRVLVERYLRLLIERIQEAPPGPMLMTGAETILAITFTEKAAREMRDRIRTKVEERARAAPRSERTDWEARRTAIESARIGTIHSFCAMLLRSHPAEAKIDPGFRVLNETEALLLLTESIDAALSDMASRKQGAGNSGQMYAVLLDEFSPRELHDMLFGLMRSGDEARAALRSLPATPDALQQQWRDWLATAQATALHDLLTSDTWQDSCAVIQRLAVVAPIDDPIGSQVCGLAAWLAQTGQPGAVDFAPVVAINLKGGSRKRWGSHADNLDMAKQALKTLREQYTVGRRGCTSLQSLLELLPDEVTEQRAAHIVLDLASLYWRAVEVYTRRKQQQDVLDFDDLEARACLLLEHPRVRARWQAELQAVLVDEFQDTNDEQRAIIYAVTGFAPPSPEEQVVADASPPFSPSLPHPPQLFVVGDGKQSIYRFRGADVSLFRAVAADIQAQGGRAVALDTSFRTHAVLLEWINGVFQTIFARRGSLRPYEVPFEPLQPHRSPPDYEQCVELHCITEAQEAPTIRDTEARIVAGRIVALCAGEAGNLVYDHDSRCWCPPDYGDIALLFQASNAFEYYEHALREAGIPYLTTAGRGYYGRKEVQDLIHLLAVLYDPTDELALVGILRSPLFALDDETLLHLRFAEQPGVWEALMTEDGVVSSALGDADRAAALAFARATLRDLYAMRGRVTVVHLLREALARTGYLATISGLSDGERRRVNVEKLIEAARQSGIRELSAFTAYLEEVLRSEPREGEAPLESTGSVRLMTVHRSKGLEFPVVVLPDLGRSSPPRRDMWLARRAYGLALKLRGATADWKQPVAYQLALAEEQRMEQAERERLLYVAMTRAQDYLVLSGPVAKKDGPDWLSRLINALGWSWEQGGPPPGCWGALEVFGH